MIPFFIANLWNSELQVIASLAKIRITVLGLQDPCTNLAVSLDFTRRKKTVGNYSIALCSLVLADTTANCCSSTE